MVGFGNNCETSRSSFLIHSRQQLECFQDQKASLTLPRWNPRQQLFGMYWKVKLDHLPQAAWVTVTS